MVICSLNGSENIVCIISRTGGYVERKTNSAIKYILAAVFFGLCVSFHGFCHADQEITQEIGDSPQDEEYYSEELGSKIRHDTITARNEDDMAEDISEDAWNEQPDLAVVDSEGEEERPPAHLIK